MRLPKPMPKAWPDEVKKRFMSLGHMINDADDLADKLKRGHRQRIKSLVAQAMQAKTGHDWDEADRIVDWILREARKQKREQQKTGG